MKNNKKPRSRTDEIVVQEMNGEVLVYDLRVDKAFCLNETAAIVWKACDGTRSIEEIGRFASEQTRSNVSDDFVWLALDQFKKDRLLENGEEIPTRFTGVSRRELIKKIGLGTAIALPVVASLIAPKAAHAASCTSTAACTCTGPNGGTGNICTPVAPGCPSGCVCRWLNNGNSNGVCGV